MAMQPGGRKGIKADINITPMVDVVLVLLIIFMVVTPMLQRGKDVKLPQATKADAERKGAADPLVISVTPDRRIYLESDEYDEAGFQAALQARLSKQPGRRLLLKGDRSLTFDDVRRVMHLAHGAGAKSIALGVEELAR